MLRFVGHTAQHKPAVMDVASVASAANKILRSPEVATLLLAKNPVVWRQSPESFDRIDAASCAACNLNCILSHSSPFLFQQDFAGDCDTMRHAARQRGSE